jgi:hypothetical protein
MRRLAVLLGVALLLVVSATAAYANIFVTISDGTITRSASIGGLVLTKPSPKPSSSTGDFTDTLNILTCAARPCAVHFPSGSTAATPPTGTTFTIHDVSATATGLARVEKFDSAASADRVSFKGVKITSRVAGRTLTITYGVQSGDLRSLSSTSSSYTGTAALTGSFKTAGGLRALGCNTGATATDVGISCVKLSLKLNGTTVNGVGSTAVATVSVPCNNAFPTVNPCGTNGSYTSALGSFTGVNDTKSISCAATCNPTQVGTVTAKFNGSGEVLQLTASALGGMANIPDEAGGLEEVHLALAEDLGLNRWVAYSAASERCRAVFKAPTINDTRNVTNKSTLPISTEYHCGFFAPLPVGQGIDLVSIVDPEAEADLAGSAATRNDASRVGFLPAAGLQVKDISVLSLTYDVVVGLSASGNTTLGNLQFDDCLNGSFHVAIETRTAQGAPAGIAKVYLGSAAGDDFKSGCNGFESIGADLVNNEDERVDTSGLVGNLASPCCITFEQLQQGQTGKLVVRRISVVLDQGSPSTSPANYKVIFKDGSVNGITAFATLQVVTGEQRTFDLDTSGVSFTVVKLTSPSNPNFVPTVVKVIPSSQIVINGGKFTAHVNVTELAAESGAQYTISLCPNGAESDAAIGAPPNTPVGLCIPDQAFFTLL